MNAKSNRVYPYSATGGATCTPTAPNASRQNVFGFDRFGVAAIFLFAHPWTAILITTSGLACLSHPGLRFRTGFRLAVGRSAKDYR